MNYILWYHTGFMWAHHRAALRKQPVWVTQHSFQCVTQCLPPTRTYSVIWVYRLLGLCGDAHLCVRLKLCRVDKDIWSNALTLTEFWFINKLLFSIEGRNDPLKSFLYAKAWTWHVWIKMQEFYKFTPGNITKLNVLPQEPTTVKMNVYKLLRVWFINSTQSYVISCWCINRPHVAHFQKQFSRKWIRLTRRESTRRSRLPQ